MNVNDRFLLFADFGRTLWGDYLLKFIDPDRLSRMCWHYDSIMSRMFQISLLEPIGIFTAPGSGFQDFPRVFTIQLINPDSENVMVSRDAEPSGYWDASLSGVNLEGLELEFIAFFDFDQIDGRKLEYVEGVVSKFPGANHYVGRHALIAADCVHVVINPSQAKPAQRE